MSEFTGFCVEGKEDSCKKKKMVSKISGFERTGPQIRVKKGVPQCICSHVFIENRPCHLPRSPLHSVNCWY